VPVLYSYLARERKPKAVAEDARAAVGGAIDAHMPASKD
jgi:hypothetical protein